MLASPVSLPARKTLPARPRSAKSAPRVPRHSPPGEPDPVPQRPVEQGEEHSVTPSSDRVTTPPTPETGDMAPGGVTRRGHGALFGTRCRGGELAGARPGPGHGGLAGLLDAARDSTPRGGSGGGRVAGAGFLTARQRAVPPAPSRRDSLEVRTTAMRVAALGFNVVAFGGTASAARTGSSSTATRQRAHAALSGSGVPPPGPQATATPRTSARPAECRPQGHKQRPGHGPAQGQIGAEPSGTGQDIRNGKGRGPR